MAINLTMRFVTLPTRGHHEHFNKIQINEVKFLYIRQINREVKIRIKITLMHTSW